VNIWFYTAWPGLGQLPAAVRLGMAVAVLWLAVFAFAVAQVGWAFMALQDAPLGKSLKRGLLVAAAHPLACLMALGLGVALAAALALTVAGAVALLGALLANLAMGAAGGAIEYYEEKDDRAERERLDREGARSWSELRALDEREAARRRRNGRTWREILRPWELR
jgi:hypothetical protein